MFFYKANFCCDCGIILKTTSWKQKFLLSRYFCITCGKRLKVVIWKRRGFKVVLLFLLPIFLTKIYLANSVSRQDHIVYQTTNIQSEKKIPTSSIPREEFWVCEAKTKKGKKCQRRIKKPGYCWQHQNLTK